MKSSPALNLRALAIFVGILSLILFFANSVVYLALVDIFSLDDVLQRAGLAAMLGLFSISFVCSLLVGRRYYNGFTRVFCTLSAMWIGLFVYLFFVSVVYGLLPMLTGEPQQFIGKALLALALFATGYGLLHARAIRIKHLTISLPNIPNVWKGKKLVMLSDVHLGQMHGSAFCERVVKKIQALPHDMVCICGDLFDGTAAPDVHDLVAPFKVLTAKKSVYFVPGNHEEFASNEVFLNAASKAGMTVLLDEMKVIDRLQLIGVDYQTASKKEDFEKILSRLSIDRELPSILLKHEPKDIEVARNAGISLQLSGHTHRAQMWPFTYIAKLVYKQFVHGLNRTGNLQVYTSSGVGSWGPPVRVGTDSEIVVITFS